MRQEPVLLCTNFLKAWQCAALLVLEAEALVTALGNCLPTDVSLFLIFSSTFFLLFIFPLGIWIIQPNVNQLYAQLTPSEMFRRED